MCSLREAAYPAARPLPLRLTRYKAPAVAAADHGQLAGRSGAVLVAAAGKGSASCGHHSRRRRAPGELAEHETTPSISQLAADPLKVGHADVMLMGATELGAKRDENRLNSPMCQFSKHRDVLVTDG